MSFMTPILMTPSDTWALAVPAVVNVAATAAAMSVRLSFIAGFSCEKTLLSYPEILVQLVHVRFQLRVRNHVHHAAVLHHVVPVRDRRGEAEILLHQQDREAFELEARDGAADLLHDH